MRGGYGRVCGEFCSARGGMGLGASVIPPRTTLGWTMARFRVRFDFQDHTGDLIITAEDYETCSISSERVPAHQLTGLDRDGFVKKCSEVLNRLLSAVSAGYKIPAEKKVFPDIPWESCLGERGFMD